MLPKLAVRSRYLLLCIGLWGLSVVACKKKPIVETPRYWIPEIGISVPKYEGWLPDETVRLQDMAKGGLVFRLMRENSVLLAPRIDVVLEPLRNFDTILDDFVTQNLRELAEYEKKGIIRIITIDQKPLKLGPRRAYRIQHEYTMNPDRKSETIAITQISNLFVLNGRGIAMTALGRTELFHPLAPMIEKIIRGVEIPVPVSQQKQRLSKHDKVETQSDSTIPTNDNNIGFGATIIQPIDLGKIGGKKSLPATDP